MKHYFYVLMRYFLRVDGSKANIMDTRFYHEAGTRHILKEHTIREANLADTPLPVEVLTNPVELASKLPLVKEELSRLEFSQ